MKIYSNGKDRVLKGDFPTRFKLLNAGVEVPYIRTGKQTVRLSGEIPFGELDVEEIVRKKVPQPAKLNAESIAIINKKDFDQIDILSKKLTINQEQMSNHLSALTEQEATLANLETQNAQAIDQTNMNMVEMAKAFGKEIQADRDSLVATSENIKQVLSETAEVLDAKLQAHEVAKNPHKISKETVGLGAVDNTSDLDKPVSNATQKALDKKADKKDIENLDKRLLESDKKQDTLMRNLETVNLYGGVGGNELPTGGKKGQVLAKKSNKDGDYEWSSAAGGVSIHNDLTGRSAENAHPISSITGLQNALTSETTNRENADNGLQSQIDAITASSDVKDVVGTYAQLQAYDTSTLGNNDIIKVLQDETHSDETTYYRWSTTTETFSLIGEEGPYYTKSEANSTFVPQTRTVNGQALSSDISLTASDVGAASSSDLSNYVTLNTSQKIQAAKAIFGTDVAFGSDSTQKNLLAVVSNNNSTGGNWIGRLTVGAKNKTFIMGTYGSICALGAHSWTNAQQGTGAAWEPVYINPDGDKAVYIGGSPINNKQALMVIQNVNANTTGTVKINRSTNLSNNFKDVACWGDNVSKFTNDAGYITGITSTDVTNALGYTPYDSSNPNGYTTNVGTVTSVNNTSPDSNGNVTITIPDSLPSQTGHSGEFLTTDGTDASWSAINALQNKSTGTSSLVIEGNANSISYGVAVGYGTAASYNGTVVGYSASSGASNTVSVGASSYTGSLNSVAVGSNAMVMYSSNGSTALGYYAKIGNNASAAIQLGYGTNSTANTLAVGFNNNNYTLLNGTTGLIPPERHASVSNTAGDYYAKITVDGQGNVTQSWDTVQTGSQKTFDLFDNKWTDYLLDDQNWLRSDTFSWQDGTVYTEAYNHLVDDIDGKTATTETIGSYTISYYLADDGHKITTDETNVANIYNESGVAWYYILDTTNQRFKLPRENPNREVLPLSAKTKSNNAQITYSNGYDLSNRGLVNTINQQQIAIYGSTSGTSRPLYYGNETGIIADLSTTTGVYKGKKYLYFYVGQFTQSATEQTAGLNSELFNGKADIDMSNVPSNIGSTAKSYFAGVGMPSDTYEDLTYGGTSDFHVAPANGYIYIAANKPNNDTVVGLTVSDENQTTNAQVNANPLYQSFTRITGYNAGVWMAIRKNQTFIASGGSETLGTVVRYRFIYAEGEV